MIFLGQLQEGLRSPSVSSVIDTLAVITCRKFHKNQFLAFFSCSNDRQNGKYTHVVNLNEGLPVVVQTELVILNQDSNLSFLCQKGPTLHENSMYLVDLR